MERNLEKKFSNYSSCNLKNASGITLIALVVTIIVLLILAGVSLSAVFSDKGIFSRAEDAGVKYNEAKAREVLETVLLADGQYEKNINPEYNQDDFLDELIINEIPGTEIKGDVAIVGGWGFELDRSVPKIGRGLGKADKLVFPTVDATSELASDRKSATINITAIEEQHGINKIEIWLLGEKIEEYTYDNVKTEITVNPPYIATQNGKYIIKAYGDLMASTTVEVTGIIPEIEFEPNGNDEWKKEHSTKVIIQETEEKIKTMKYQWTNSVTEPADNTFTQGCKDGDTITGGNDTMTGQYYLWILLETENGATAKRRSEAFNFDNEGPTITAFTATKYSTNGITLSATARDAKSGIVKFEFYVDGTIQNKYTQTMSTTTSKITKTVNVTGLSTGEHECMVKVYDEANNYSTNSSSGTTKLYAWQTYSTKKVDVYSLVKTGTEDLEFSWLAATDRVFCYTTAKATPTGINLSGSGYSKFQPTSGWWKEYPNDNKKAVCFVEQIGDITFMDGEDPNRKAVWRCDVYKSAVTSVRTEQGSELLDIVTSNQVSKYPVNRISG